MLTNDREKYEAFWKEFGRQIKFGAYSDYGMHGELLRDLLLFWSAKEQKMVTLQEYVDKMPAERSSSTLQPVTPPTVWPSSPPLSWCWIRATTCCC